MLPRCLSENIEHVIYEYLPDEYTARYHEILINSYLVTSFIIF